MAELTSPIPEEKEPRRKIIIRWTIITLIILWLILPMIPLLIWSFAFRWPFPLLWPESWSLRAWELAFAQQTGVLAAIWDSVVIAVIVTVISIIISIPAGRGLGMYNFKGKRVVEFLLLAPTIVPPLVVILGILVLFIRYGLADTFTGVILVQLSPIMPYVVLVMAGVFSNYNPEFEEQARSLGAGPIQTFWYVTLPAIFPGMMVAGLFAFLISWSQYITTLLIGGGFVRTLPLVLFTLAGTNDTALTAAVSIIFVLPAIVILLITSRYVTGEDAAIGGIGGV